MVPPTVGGGNFGPWANAISSGSIEVLGYFRGNGTAKGLTLLRCVPQNDVTLPVPDVRTVRRWILTTIGVIVLAYLAWVVREIWLPLGLAFVLATVLDPVVDRMEARGWKRVPASAAIFGTTLVILIGLIALAFPHLVAQGAEMQRQFEKYFPDTSHEGLVRSFTKLNFSAGVAALGAKAFESAQAGFNRSSTYLTSYGMSFVTNLIWVVIVPIVAFYALCDFHLILGKALLLVPRRHRGAAQSYVSEVSAVFARYLRGLGILSVLNGVATWLLLWAVGVPSALVVGIIAGILYAVPYIGALMTIVVTAAAAFVGGGVSTMIWAVGLSVLLHQILFDQIIAPRVLGGQVGLHPILSIIALLSGNLLLGIIGMILAVPIAACIQILVLALVPKLQVAIELPEGGPAATEGGQIATESRTIQAESDATETLHGGVQRAVAEVEQQLDNTPAGSVPEILTPPTLKPS
ncbi:AI-2E family transporter [bacterium]|nr:MAG: AI-2E family transporter [bacterium]